MSNRTKPKSVHDQSYCVYHTAQSEQSSSSQSCDRCEESHRCEELCIQSSKTTTKNNESQHWKDNKVRSIDEKELPTLDMSMEDTRYAATSQGLVLSSQAIHHSVLTTFPKTNHQLPWGRYRLGTGPLVLLCETFDHLYMGLYFTSLSSSYHRSWPPV